MLGFNEVGVAAIPSWTFKEIWLFDRVTNSGTITSAAFETAMTRSAASRILIRLEEKLADRDCGCFLLWVLALYLFIAAESWASSTPIVQPERFDSRIWDSAGSYATTLWLHPGEWTPDQNWGWLSGDVQIPNILGSWGGIRDQLYLAGISFGASYTGQLGANPIGGAKKGGTSWIGDWSLETYVDFARLFDLDQKVFFTASLDIESGDAGLTTHYVGNLFPVQLSSSGSSGVNVSLVHLAFGAQFLEDKAEIVGGRIITGEDFASISQACSSLNQGICGNPIAGASSISFPQYPDAVWGSRITLGPEMSWYAQAGAYLVYPGLGDPDDHGIQFGASDGSGILTIGEAGVHVGNRSGRSGLPGTYILGGYYDTEQLTNLATGAGQRNTWGVYAMGEQMLYSENSDYSNGLWAWLALSYAPPDVNELQFMAAGGLTYIGPISSRPDDAVSIVAAVGVFSDRLVDQGSETVLEINYRAQLMPAFYVQPDIQYIINPDGDSNIDNAVVVGFAVGATF